MSKDEIDRKMFLYDFFYLLWMMIYFILWKKDNIDRNVAIGFYIVILKKENIDRNMLLYDFILLFF